VRALVLIPLAAVSFALVACGTEGVDTSSDDSAEIQRGGELFAERCGGCHTLEPAGTQGSGGRTQRVQGPNFDQRNETYEDALFAIQNGGFSGAIMPQNIVVGDDAVAVARFLEEYSGRDVSDPPRPGAP
jgi:mono/diheme cytochrome c family protein